MVAIEITVLPAEIVRVVATNVRSFTDAAKIRDGVAGIPGVERVSIEAPGGGLLTFVIEYQGVVPFAVHLNELLNRRFDRVFPDHVAIEEYEIIDPNQGNKTSPTASVA